VRGCEKVSFVKGTGTESSLPEMSFPSFPDIDDRRVLAMSFTEDNSEVVFISGNTDQVNVVVHKAIGQPTQAGGSGMFCE